MRKSLTKKKYQGIILESLYKILNPFLEEQMLKRIFEEGLATQKNRLRELRSYAQGQIFQDFRGDQNWFLEMRAEENKKREAELQSIENFYRDKFEILAEDMKVQKEKK